MFEPRSPLRLISASLGSKKCPVFPQWHRIHVFKCSESGKNFIHQKCWWNYFTMQFDLQIGDLSYIIELTLNGYIATIAIRANNTIIQLQVQVFLLSIVSLTRNTIITMYLCYISCYRDTKLLFYHTRLLLYLNILNSFWTCSYFYPYFKVSCNLFLLFKNPMEL